MRITRIAASSFPLTTNLSNSRRVLKEIRITVVAVESDIVREGRRLTGYGFSSFGRPSCDAQIRERMAPRVLAAAPESLLDPARENFDPLRIWACAGSGEKPAGHAERSTAIGTLDLAVWDLVAKIERKPLHRVLAERYSGGSVRDRVFCYVGGGWYRPGQTVADLQSEMRGHLDAGYTQLKMKVGGLALGDDCRRVEAVLAVVGSGRNLAVDANAVFDRETAIERARSLAPYELRWFEEPCNPLDYESYKAVASCYAPPIASGECLSGSQELDNFLRYSGLRPDRDIIQLDPPLSYGVTEYLDIIRVAEQHGFGRGSLFPHGGNLMSLHVAGGFGLGGSESYPGVFGAFGGFNDEVTIEDGCARLPSSPGLGFEQKAELFPMMRGLLD
jgi:L-alanine-DL-glutamate epimerase-like enolase superfamily enzyme